VLWNYLGGGYLCRRTGIDLLGVSRLKRYTNRTLRKLCFEGCARRPASRENDRVRIAGALPRLLPFGERRKSPVREGGGAPCVELERVDTPDETSKIIAGLRLVRACDYVTPPRVARRRPYRWCDAWRDLYRAYLASPAWRAKRLLVVERCDGICQCGQPVSDVHHLSYEHAFDEPLEDLIALCRACHRRAHGIEII
jgi:hypothetical protein